MAKESKAQFILQTLIIHGSSLTHLFSYIVFIGVKILTIIFIFPLWKLNFTTEKPGVTKIW